ncbi:MAG: CDP-alcohol phosphatidyltransferase family protein [Gammaproteobacteria bacterium]|nr:CDP-alcohol phosphatidyltransferase family protein [Gammaproteobacteria bacterium]
MLQHLPNAICLIRIVLTVPTVNAIDRGDYALALAVFSIAAISDGLDGYLAKRFGWTSYLGRVLDPLADKILLVAAFLACAWQGLVPVWLAAAAIARDVMLVGGAIIYRLWFGPIDEHPSRVSKVNTTLQIMVVILAMLDAAVAIVPAALLLSLAVATFVTTVVSGVDYMGRSFRRAWHLPAPP